eukprot:COSAG02_NODE_6054_length_3836_cov_2.445068_5_plen_94_part_00
MCVRTSVGLVSVPLPQYLQRRLHSTDTLDLRLNAPVCWSQHLPDVLQYCLMVGPPHRVTLELVALGVFHACTLAAVVNCSSRYMSNAETESPR